MSYNRKQFDKRKLKKLASKCSGWCGGSYYNERKGCYIRFWKSQGKNSIYAFFKRESRRKARRYFKKYGFWSKKSDDLWWNVW